MSNKRIFVSWSGDNSKQIAKQLKSTLEDGIFKDTDLECFVSDTDISSGDDWWNKIKTELKECSMGIVCITKENLKAPWIYYESGAMVAHDIKVIPLLFNCSFKLLNDTPIHSKNMVDFYNQDKFLKMIKDINKELSILSIPDSSLDAISTVQYNIMIDKLSPIFKKLKAMRVFNEQYIYPKKINTVNLNTIYISAPMSSLNSKEYYELRDFLLKLKPKLERIGFTKVECPAFEKDDYYNFDGHTKAIKENYVEMKQVDSLLVIYPNAQPSSVLVEIGYGLALCKKTVIFYKESLPYILKDAGTNISHIDTRKYNSFDDILSIIRSNGKQLFKDEEDE